MTFGERLKVRRKELGLTQEDVAMAVNEKCHYSYQKSTISNYENRGSMPSLDVLKALTEILHCTSDFLIGAEAPKEEEKNEDVKLTISTDTLMIAIEYDKLTEEQKNIIRTLIRIYKK